MALSFWNSICYHSIRFWNEGKMIQNWNRWIIIFRNWIYDKNINVFSIDGGWWGSERWNHSEWKWHLSFTFYRIRPGHSAPFSSSGKRIKDNKKYCEYLVAESFISFPFTIYSHATIRNNNIFSTIFRCQSYVCVWEFSKRLCKNQIV